MAEITPIINLQKYTRLPLSVIQVADKQFPTVIVKTPTGETAIDLKETSYSLFGGLNVKEKSVVEVIEEIHELEVEAKNFLLNQWLSKK